MGMRLFFAVPAPAAVQGALAEWGREARRRGDGWRWVDPATIHLTLRFLGETDAALVAPLVEAAQAIAGREPRHAVTARGWGVFPSPARPRVLWAGLAGELSQLARLAGALEAEARRRGFAPEERGFRAHLTLARAVRDAQPRLPGRPDDEQPEFGPFPVDELLLVQSHLGPGGAVYEPLARVPLGGGGTP